MPQKYKWATLDKSPWMANCYTVGLSEEAVQIVSRLVPKGYNKTFSYSWLIISLFGLKPNDFFHYIQFKYQAVIQSSKNSIYKIVYFPSVVKAYDFANEVERRFKLCIDEGYFGEQYDEGIPAANNNSL